MSLTTPFIESNGLAAARFALVKVAERHRRVQRFISAFEIDVVTARYISLGVSNQPIPSIQVKNASWGGDV
jgi:hypothetical protein